MIKPLDELRKPDERTLHFTPDGLGIGVKMSPEAAAEFQQQVVAQYQLATAVAEGTRQSFDRLRTIFAYGVLCYDIFTLVNDHALLVIEQALRDRFLDWHRGTVTFVEPEGREHEVVAERYEQIHEAISKHKKWQLRVGDGPETMQFNGTLAGLRAWARRVGLLRGQRNRGIERALSSLRNFVAHPTAYHLLGPVDAARTLSDLAEIINQLWGYPTPGGRLYPAPIRREVVAIGWNADEGSFVTMLAKNLHHAVQHDDGWEYAIIRAVFKPGELVADPELNQFDSRFEATHFPSELLWGAGSRADGTAWLDANRPEPDERDYLDRTFIIRQDENQIYLAMRPEIAVTLPIADQSGDWHVIRADHPNDAFCHVRNLATGGACARTGPCPQCHAETLRSGTYDDVLEPFADDFAGEPSASTPDVRTPFAYPRSYEINR